MAAFWYVWRDVFDKAKVKLPNTFEEAKQAAAALNRPKDNFYGMGQSWNRTADGYGVMQSLMYSYGAGWADKAGKYKSIKTPAMQQVMKWATDIYKDGLQPPDTLTWTGSGQQRELHRQEHRPDVERAQHHLRARERARQGHRRQGEEGSGRRRSPTHVALPHPAGPDGRRMWAIAMSMGIFKNSKDPEAADEPHRASPLAGGDRSRS